MADSEKHWVRQIAGRASTIWERLGPGCVPIIRPESAQPFRIARWSATACRGESSRLLEFTRGLGIPDFELECRLRCVDLSGNMPMPEWCEMLYRIVVTVGQERRLLTLQSAVAETQQFAVNMLKERIRSTDESALMQTHLSQVTSSLNCWLVHLFEAMHAAHFNSNMQAGKECSFSITELFQHFPVAARLISTAVCNWVGSLTEFFLRLQIDEPLLQSVFGSRYCLSAVRNIEFASDDPHDGGRRVLRIDFVNAPSLFYKPRSMGAERALTGFLREIFADKPIIHLSCLDRGCYGWNQQVTESAGARSHEYWVNAGRLLFAAQLCGLRDLHSDNVVHRADRPVPVDLEAAFSSGQRPARRWRNAAGDPVLDVWLESAVMTGLLPRWHPDGTDIECGLSFPESSGACEESITSLLTGYAEAYRALASGDQQLLRAAADSHGIRHAVARVILRDTSGYASIFAGMLAPDSLRDGFEFGLVIEAACPHDFRDPALAIHRAETEALTRMDVPRFITRSDGRDLMTSQPQSVTVPDFFNEPGIDSLFRRLDRLTERNLKQNCEQIRGVIASRLRMFPQTISRPNLPENRSLLQIALEIADGLHHSAVYAQGGFVTWLTPCRTIDPEKYIFAEIDLSLTTGLTGIAVFLAAACQCAGRSQDRTLLDSVIRTITSRIAPLSGQKRNLRDSEILTFVSLLYPLCVAARLAPNAGELCTASRVLVQLASKICFSRNSASGICGGAAGAIIGLWLCECSLGISGAADAAVAVSSALVHCSGSSASKETGRQSDHVFASQLARVLSSAPPSREVVAATMTDVVERNRREKFLQLSNDITDPNIKDPTRYKLELQLLDCSSASVTDFKTRVRHCVANYYKTLNDESTCASIPLSLIPGFGVGAAGLGYQLLRTSPDSQLPYVLNGGGAVL
jgi:hypothetical protein